MMLKRFILIGLPLVLLLTVSSISTARMLHESKRIALYSTQAEQGNRNNHPCTLDADQLSAALSQLKARSGETDELIELFPEKNRLEAAQRMARELGRIGADQDLHLVSFRKVGSFLHGSRNASAARVFVEGGRLNLIFGQIDRFYSDFRDPDKTVPPMGSRQQAASLKGRIMPTQGVTIVDGRNDWVALELAPGQAATQAPPEAANREGKSIEEKLQILKNLRTKDLITEQEYSEKKQQILDGL